MVVKMSSERVVEMGRAWNVMDDPEIRKKQQINCKRACEIKNVGDKNPAKNIEVRKKISEYRKQWFKKHLSWKPWNKGLTAKTDERVARNIESTRKAVLKCIENGTWQQVHKYPYRDTEIEVALQNELRKRNIPFETQKYVVETTADIFIQPNICVFADGDYWHGHECVKGSKVEKREWDDRINTTLGQHNFLVFRFWECEIRRDVVNCINRVLEICVGLSNFAGAQICPVE